MTAAPAIRSSARVAVVGARGHAGAELLRLLRDHPDMGIGYAGSRALAGQPLSTAAEDLPTDIVFQPVQPEVVVAAECDAWVLALPNGLSQPYVEAAVKHAPDIALVDLSADHRFQDDWCYGLPELQRERLRGARRVANPGCYATAAQLAIAPFAAELEAPPRIFGVSGYSGAGTTPSPRNDPQRLRDNLMPYALVDHTHEREIGHQLGQPVHFMPHVAPFFRGISLTIDLLLTRNATADELTARLEQRYRDEPLVQVQREVPQVRAIVGTKGVCIGGLHCDGRRAVVVATIDNLLKGAASQCLQNLNLALGFDELSGIDTRMPAAAEGG